MNEHWVYLLIYLSRNPGKGGLIIHPENLSSSVVKLLNTLGVPPKRATQYDITFANGSMLRLSTGDERSYKSCTFEIVYIHETIDPLQLATLQAAIPNGGLVMTRVGL